MQNGVIADVLFIGFGSVSPLRWMPAGEEVTCRWSPDARWLAIAAAETSPHGVRSML